MTSSPKKGEFEDDTVVGTLDPDPKGTLQLVVIAQTGVRSYPLPQQGELRIGRHSASEVRIDEASISRFHAVLYLKGATVTIEDLGSANGTRIGGTRLKSGKQVPFAIGETIRLGSVTLVIQPAERTGKR